MQIGVVLPEGLNYKMANASIVNSHFMERITAVHKVWHANGLKPHLTKTFKVSRYPKFAEKTEYITGLSMSPP